MPAAPVNRVIADYRDAGLTPPERALCDYAVKLARTPGAMREADVDTLRAAGWNDEEILAAVGVIAYFSFINRMADGLGVDLEPEMEGLPPLPPCPW